MGNKAKIGLFFGSFNPIHVGHMVIANYMLEFTVLQEVWLVVTPHSPYKKKAKLLNDYNRLEMVLLAIGENLRMRASDIEFSLPKPNYTIHTLVHLEEKYPDKEFSLIMGEDNLSTLDKWKNHDIILENYYIYVYPRFSKLKNKKKPEGKIIYTRAPIVEISSSMIRRGIKQGKDMRHFIPLLAWEYLDSSGFYR